MKSRLLCPVAIKLTAIVLPAPGSVWYFVVNMRFAPGRIRPCVILSQTIRAAEKVKV